MAKEEKKKGRFYPASPENEKSVLAAFMLDRKAVSEYVGELKISDFNDKAHQKIFMAMCALVSENKPVDIVSVADKLSLQGTLEEVGDFPYLTQIANTIPSAAGCKYYVDALKRDGLLRALLDASKEIAEDVYTSDDGEASLSKAQSLILNVAKEREHSALVHVGSVVDDVMRGIEEKHADPDSARGLLTGFSNFDAATNGLQRSDVLILAARPGIGKTAFALNIATNIAKRDNKKKILIFSLEMGSGQLVQRMLCNIAGVNNYDINKGELEVEHFVSLNGARQELWNSQIYVDDTAMQSPSDILSKCHRFKMEHGDIDLLIIDYLQLMTSTKEGGRQNEVADISRRMKLIAKEINVPVILLSQMSRGSEIANEKPELTDLRDSGAIEQDADIVMFLYKKRNQALENPIIELMIKKYRNGQQCNMAFEWHGANFRFVPMDKSVLDHIPTVSADGDSERGRKLARESAPAVENQGGND